MRYTLQNNRWITCMSPNQKKMGIYAMVETNTLFDIY